MHFLLIAFVVGGEVCIVMGFFRGWHWVRHLCFRVLHLLVIAVVVGQTWLNRSCPLTVWESALRQETGQQPYAGSFIQHWLGRLVYYEAPQWVFTAVYTFFGAVVLFSWFWVKPEKRGIMRGRETI
ncbi:MAG: DUF2784 domain-containing protein [Deltaproteobacteria bacterium]|nr:DUF2784 domain-containing protein [Deltaproteobacteria bacterium]